MSSRGAGQRLRQQAMGAVGSLAYPVGGNVIYVDSTNGNDGNDGESERHAVKTLTRAVALATAGDTIVCNPGGSETVTATISVSVANVKIICPVKNAAQGFTITGAGTLDLITVSGADCHIEGLGFAHTGATANASCILTTEAADNLTVVNCDFDDSAIATTFTGAGIKITDATQHVLIEGCRFRDMVSGVLLAVGASKAQIGGLVKDCHFWVGQSAAFGIYANINGSGSSRGWVVRDCVFLEADGDGSSATAAWDGTDGTNATQGPIQATATWDQYAVIGCLAYTALATGFDVLNAIAGGAAGDLIGNRTGAAGDVEDLITTVDTVVDTIAAEISGAAGIATFPAAAAAANNVSLAEVIRYISENQLPRLVSKANASMASGFGTGDSPVAQFTVTGDVLVRCWGVVTTNMTSTGGTGTISLGTADNVAVLIPAATADATALQAGDVWADATSGSNALGLPDDGSWVAIGNGADIVMTIATNDITAGGMTVYCEWKPVSSGSSVVAA